MATGFPDGLEDCLETRLNRATNPLQTEENWEHIVSFCDMINKDIDGPQTAVRLITHKIQSPQEKESLFALTTLEACVKNCGLRFQQEVGKFRFINEIIKVISPKYLGNHMSVKVKERCIRLLFMWSESLKHEPKINEAYTMLKKQGIVKEDPLLGESTASAVDNHQPIPYHPPAPQTSPSIQSNKNQIFNDEEKSKLLTKLLKSKNPDDLQAANRLIKTMVKQDEERVEKVTRRTHQLETVMNNVKLLNEMLKNYQPLSSTESDVEIMKELSENIEKQRPALFKLASDSDEKDASGAIGEILKVNDEVIQVLSTYDSLINQSTVGKLLLLDNDANNEAKGKAAGDAAAATAPATKAATAAASKALPSSLLDEQLLSLDLFSSPTIPLSTTTTHHHHHPPNPSVALTTATHNSSNAAADLSSIFSAAAIFNTSTTTTNNILPSKTTTTTNHPFYNSNNMLDPLKQQQPPPYQQHQQQQPFHQTFPSPTTTTSINNNKYNLFSDSFNTTINTTSSSSSSSSSSSGLDVLNQMLVNSLKDSGMKGQVDNSAKKVAMKEINKRTTETAHSLNNPNNNTSNNNPNNNSNNNDSLFSLSDSNKSVVGGVDLLDDKLLFTDLPTTTTTTTTTHNDVFNEMNGDVSHINNTTPSNISSSNTTTTTNSNSNNKNNLPATTTATTTTATTGLSNKLEVTSDNKANIEIKPLKDIVMSLESFKPGKRESRQIFNKDGVTCKLHFSDVRPRDDVIVIAMTTTNTSPLPIEDFTFLATVSKGAKVKVQAPNSRNLAPFNPILPPPLISLLILVANPRKEALRLKFTVSYLLDDNIVTEMGEVDDLPVE